MFFSLLNLTAFSYSDLPKTDAFFLTLAILTIIIPPFLVLFFGKLCRKIQEILYLIEIEAIINNSAIRKTGLIEGWEKNRHRAEIFKSNPGNFLSLVDGLNSALRLIIMDNFKKKIPKYACHDEMISILSKEKVLSKSGVKKMRFICWLYGHILSGEVRKFFPKTINLGMRVVWSVHEEFNEWMLREERIKTEQSK